MDLDFSTKNYNNLLATFFYYTKWYIEEKSLAVNWTQTVPNDFCREFGLSFGQNCDLHIGITHSLIFVHKSFILFKTFRNLS